MRRSVARSRRLRAQTVPAEIIVVDSGSVDGSLELARREADRVLEIPPERFSYGYALNIGAGAASADVHFALSSHCFAPPHWIETALTHYERADVAATNGIQTFADGRPVTEPFVQDAAHARADPWWGFSNHASSWRASAWWEHPFDERMDYAEDREWAWRVTAAGWTIVYDPALWVDLSHSWRGRAQLLHAPAARGPGRRRVLGRARRTACATSRATGGATSPTIATHPRRTASSTWAAFAGLLGHYVGRREAAARR